MLARRYWISGSVQGVGFRYFVLREVERIGTIRGFVRNLRDGGVEVYAEASDDLLTQLEAALRKGPRSSVVRDIRIVDEAPGDQYPDFRITF